MILQVNDLCVGYSLPLLSSLHFNMDIGQKIILFGANGSGKSTLLKSLLQPSLRLAGHVEWTISKENIVTVSQNTHFHHQTPDYVEDYLFKCCLAYTPLASKKKHQDKVYSLMKTLNLPNLPLKILSGGQKQKLKIAKALLNDSQVILLDEPFNAVDTKSKSEIFQMLEVLAPKTLQIWVLHDYYDIQRLQAPVLWLKDDGPQIYSFADWFKEVDQAFHSWMKPLTTTVTT